MKANHFKDELVCATAISLDESSMNPTCRVFCAHDKTMAVLGVTTSLSYLNDKLQILFAVARAVCWHQLLPIHSVQYTAYNKYIPKIVRTEDISPKLALIPLNSNIQQLVINNLIWTKVGL